MKRAPVPGKPAALLCAALVLAGCGGGSGVARWKAPASAASRSMATTGASATTATNEESDTVASAAGERDERIAEAAAPAPPTPPPLAQPAPAGAAAANEAPSSRGPAIAVDAPHDVSMLVYTARLTMAVYQVEPGIERVAEVARQAGGYLATRSDREITVRVPRHTFHEVVAQIAKTGDVVHRDVSAEDVTDAYVDTEIRLKNARALRDRLAKLLESAPVKEAIEIEKEMARVTEELERLEGRIKLLRQKIAYSTITATFAPRAASSIPDAKVRLPFPWLSELGLPRLLHLDDPRND